jgi:uncharacterized protein (TIGR00661 family)
MQEGKRHIIVGVLNWGLGHATRSSIIIEKLLEHGFEPVLASDGLALAYLKKEFPNLITEELPSYDIKYKNSNFLLEMIRRAPSIAKAIFKEHRALKELVDKYDAYGVISDNRLGFHHKNVSSVYVTHQLTILLPFPFKWVNHVHRWFIKRFDACWVPDFPQEPSLSGELGHLKKEKLGVLYLGPLSRFSICTEGNKKNIDVLVILSGPEPQRTKLERKIISQLEQLTGKHVLVRGTNRGQCDSSSVLIKDLITGAELKDLVLSAKMTVSRSGYSSLMDYFMLQNKALLVPTPGQVEQEYLAKYHQQQKHFYSVSQKSLELAEDLKRAQTFSGFESQKVKLDWEDLFTLFKRKGKG